jgi:hypothetical protein
MQRLLGGRHGNAAAAAVCVFVVVIGVVVVVIVEWVPLLRWAKVRVR